MFLRFACRYHDLNCAGAAELLNITVGTQSISPLYWAIESGSLNTAKAMLEETLVQARATLHVWLAHTSS